MRTKATVLFFFFSIHIIHAQLQRYFNVGKDSLNLYYVDFKDAIPKIGKYSQVATPYWESFVNYNPKFGYEFIFNGWRQTAHSTNDKSKKDR